jgi:hypothetical protein
VKAILQVADTGPLESLVAMLQAVGVECYTLSNSLKKELRSIGCDTVLDIEGLVRGWGYDQPMALPVAGLADMARADVCYFDVKAHRNGPKVLKRWPSLANRIVWYRINGGKPEHVINNRGDHGDEINPGCPVLTPNQWYGTKMFLGDGHDGPITAHPQAYTCWPPFVRFDDYLAPRESSYAPPICLIHNLTGWGYSAVIDLFRQEIGVRCYGASSPDGLLQHQEIRLLLQKTIAMVHLKSNDAPGYAIYECLAAGCPLICTQRMIWRCKMEVLLEPGVTCLTFDHNEHHRPLDDRDVSLCCQEVKGHLKTLSDPGYNQTIGLAGRERLKSLMWRADRDGQSLKEFLGRAFP